MNQNEIKEHLKNELEKIKEKMKNGSLSFEYSEKNTPRDEFRESLDVTDTFTPKRQSEFAESSKQTNSGEKQYSLTTDLIQ